LPATGHWNITGSEVSAAMSGASDVLSAVPGVGFAWAIKGGKGVAEGVSGTAKISDIASQAAHPRPHGEADLEDSGGRHSAGGDQADRRRVRWPDAVKENMVNILWHGKGVASHLYHDVKQAVS
jgi:hypothetical protein